MNQKSIFIQALIASALVFVVGFLIGVYFEDNRVNLMKDTFYDSETKMNDFELSSKITFQSNQSCDTIVEKSVALANKVYAEALTLEKYDNSNKLTQRFEPLHRRYDLFRTMLWKDIIDNKKICKNKINTVVYFYTYVNPSFETKGIQGAMSNYLGDLKNEYGDRIILIPIAADTQLDSLNSLREIYNITKIPVIFVNEKYKFETLESLKDIKKALNDSLINNNSSSKKSANLKSINVSSKNTF